jgi:tocopherol cyclase
MSRLPYALRRHLNAAVFQGKNKKRSYFEGWYIKQVSDDGKFFFALIPGMAINKKGEGQAFIQLIEGYANHTEYFKFDLKSFKFDADIFNGSIAQNTFSRKGMRVDFSQHGLDFRADLSFIYPDVSPTFWVRPPLINWYSLLPGMQCYHMLISPFHYVKGEVEIKGKTHLFSKGHGYMEKDYGRGFPDRWVWVQCNNFGQNEVSVMFSAGKVSWTGISFSGFICSLTCNGRSYLFSTYSLSRITRYEVTNTQVNITIKSLNYILEIEAKGTKGGLLKAPFEGHMSRTVYETIHATMYIRFLTRKKSVIFEGYGSKAGFETEGCPDGLFNRK